MLGNLFEVLADRYKEHAYALPAKSYSKKNRNKTPEFDIFSPALVAHLYLSIENINIVDRKSTRLNSSHLVISYAVFCLKKKKTTHSRDSRHTHATHDAVT